MIYFHKGFALLTLLSLEVFIDSTYSAQAGWDQKIKEADSEQLKFLKERCSHMLVRKDNSVKIARRWTKRLKGIKQREQVRICRMCEEGRKKNGETIPSSYTTPLEQQSF